MRPRTCTPAGGSLRRRSRWPRAGTPRRSARSKVVPRTARFSAIGIEAGAAKENRAFRSARITSAPTRVITVTNSRAVIAEAEALVADEAPGARIDGRTGERRMPRTATPVVTTKRRSQQPVDTTQRCLGSVLAEPRVDQRDECLVRGGEEDGGEGERDRGRDEEGVGSAARPEEGGDRRIDREAREDARSRERGDPAGGAREAVPSACGPVLGWRFSGPRRAPPTSGTEPTDGPNPTGSASS